MTITFQRHLIIDGSSLLTESVRRAYETSTLNQLQLIARTNTGLCVLNDLHCSVRFVRIIPSQTVWPLGESSDATPTDWTGATYPFRPIRDGYGVKMTDTARDDSSRRRGSVTSRGTGVGSNVIVRHNPWYIGPPGISGVAATLVHELTHAAEEADGRLVCNPLGWRFDTQAEFDAILVGNIYCSEVKLPLRIDHQTFNVLDKPLMVPKPAFIRLLQSFRNRMPRLAQHLGEVNAPYNPLRKGAIGYVGVQGDIPGSSRYR